jgi:hypothetical protein
VLNTEHLKTLENDMAKNKQSDYVELGNDDLDVVVHTPSVETEDEKFVRRIKEAQAKSKGFELSALTKALLDASCENVANSNGNGLTDESARKEAKAKADLMSACNNDLRTALVLITETNAYEDAPSLCYSICFAVQKASNFVANLWLRRAVDPSDGEGLAAHDYRERREPPYGLGGDAPEGVEAQKQDYNAVLEAHDTLHIYLQLLTEAFGWDPENPMPFMFQQRKDGNFEPIHNGVHALDITQVKAQVARAKRQERRSTGLAAALKGARDQLLNA